MWSKSLKKGSSSDHHHSCWLPVILIYLLFTCCCQIGDTTHHHLGTIEDDYNTEILEPEKRERPSSSVSPETNTTTNSGSSSSSSSTSSIIVNKCCEKFEVYVDTYCTVVDSKDYFQPIFSQNGEFNAMENAVDVKYVFRSGIPACGSKPMWPIYDYDGSQDKLVLLTDGTLRHYVNVISNLEEESPSQQQQHQEEEEEQHQSSLHQDQIGDEEKSMIPIDYKQDQYCIERSITRRNNHNNDSSTHGRILFAHICLNKQEILWSETDFLVRKVLNPICHIISLILLLLVAVVYFILPTLRDLVGNMITTIAVCLITAQIASLVRIFTEFSNHISFMAADMVLYVSLLATFIWLNSFGYYIWKTFRSRNVFLRVTDGRKYCYYSIFVWSCTIFLGLTALFAHFFLDTDNSRQQQREQQRPITLDHHHHHQGQDQETISWLGISIFFAPIACSILVDIFFYVTTMKLINRRNVYGRIQHKLKANFTMFSLMLLVISIDWLFFCLSWLQLDGLIYTHIVMNALQAPLLLYICVLRQNHVKFLLRKTCCYNEPPSMNDWGNELHNMTSSNHQ